MTTTNGPRAALVPRFGTAGALHDAICELTGTDGTAHADLYALAGARLAVVMTRGFRFVPCAGSLSLDGRLLRARHAWIARLMGDDEPGPPLGRPIGEVADFTLRHWPGWAAADGWQPARELPPFFWGGAAELEALGVTLAGDVEATTELVHGQPVELAIAVADRALDRIARKYPAKVADR